MFKCQCPTAACCTMNPYCDVKRSGRTRSRRCRDGLSQILSVCMCVLLGRSLFSPVSIEALVLFPSQGDLSAVGRRSYENCSLASPSLSLLSASPTHPSSFRYHRIMCYHGPREDVKACFCLSFVPSPHSFPITSFPYLHVKKKKSRC